MQEGQDCPAGVRGALRGLFPVAPGPVVPLARRWRALAVTAEVTAVVAGAAVLLLRIPGVPAWDTVFAEDYSPFLIQALQHPWQLFVQYNGYEQLLPRVIAQLVTYLPLADAAKAFACCGALVAAGCALFVAHASAGHIRSVPLRCLLAAAVVLLPIAPLEIADSTVDAPWYLLLALFWAMLWRPRTRTGMAVAAVVGFVTAASTSIAVVFAPLVAIRAIALRHPREHAVTAGWLAACLVQLPVVAEALLMGQSRLAGEQNPGLGPDDWAGSLIFYLHDVVLRSVGWHVSWWLESRSSWGLTARCAGGAVHAPGPGPANGKRCWRGGRPPWSRCLRSSSLSAGWPTSATRACAARPQLIRGRRWWLSGSMTARSHVPGKSARRCSTATRRSPATAVGSYGRGSQAAGVGKLRSP